MNVIGRLSEHILLFFRVGANKDAPSLRRVDLPLANNARGSVYDMMVISSKLRFGFGYPSMIFTRMLSVSTLVPVKNRQLALGLRVIESMVSNKCD